MKQIPNFPEYTVDTEGEIHISFKNKIAKEEYRGNTFGYQFIGCVNLDTKEVELIDVTQLVADLYVPNPNNYKFVRHINGIKFDNRPSNLTWVQKRDDINQPVRKKMPWERGHKEITMSPRQRLKYDKSHEAISEEVIYG